MGSKSTTQPFREVTYTIGQVAKLSGVGIEAIRFYEREGVLKEPSRRDSGYREYDGEVLARLHFIRRAQELGFSLKEITEFLALRVNPKQNCSAVRKRAQAKLDEIEIRIRDLKRMQKTLKEVVAACEVSKPISDCPILKSFDR